MLKIFLKFFILLLYTFILLFFSSTLCFLAFFLIYVYAQIIDIRNFENLVQELNETNPPINPFLVFSIDFYVVCVHFYWEKYLSVYLLDFENISVFWDWFLKKSVFYYF